jgi:hypothetical protein
MKLLRIVYAALVGVGLCAYIVGTVLQLPVFGGKTPDWIWILLLVLALPYVIAEVGALVRVVNAPVDTDGIPHEATKPKFRE